MRTTDDFRAAYRALENRMKVLAETDGDVFLPSPEPSGPVDHVVIGMEPSLGRWSRSADDAKSRVEAGFRNFLSSTEDFILHFCVRQYLCEGAERYHITDFSKGAMLVDRANVARVARYERWYPLLREEMNLVATPEASIVAIGNDVERHLARQRFERPFTKIIHYSGQAGSARREKVSGHEDNFKAFKDLVSLEDLVAAARDVLTEARIPESISEQALLKLKRSQLTNSRLELLFGYKLAFESIRAGRSTKEGRR